MMGRHATDPGTHRGKDYEETEREYTGEEGEE